MPSLEGDASQGLLGQSLSKLLGLSWQPDERLPRCQSVSSDSYQGEWEISSI